MVLTRSRYRSGIIPEPVRDAVLEAIPLQVAAGGGILGVPQVEQPGLPGQIHVGAPDRRPFSKHRSVDDGGGVEQEVHVGTDHAQVGGGAGVT